MGYLLKGLHIVDYADARDDRPGAIAPPQFPAFAAARPPAGPWYAHDVSAGKDFCPRPSPQFPAFPLENIR